MTTNRDWLFSLPLEEQYAWMNAEHYEPDPDCSSMLYWTYTGNMEYEIEQDSRERLEADAERYIEHAADYAYEDTLWADETFTLYDAIIELLDRQAAITERETKLRELYRFEENHREHIRSLEDVNQKLNERLAELQEKVDNLAIDLADSERGKAKLREHVSRACDNAHDTLMILDEGLA